MAHKGWTHPVRTQSSSRVAPGHEETGCPDSKAFWKGAQPVWVRTGHAHCRVHTGSSAVPPPVGPLSCYLITETSLLPHGAMAAESWPPHCMISCRHPTRLPCARSTVGSCCRPPVTRTCTTGCTRSTRFWPGPYGRATLTCTCVRISAGENGGRGPGQHS